MTAFEFHSKIELLEWEIRTVFSELKWGVLWKITQESVETGWIIRVYYACLTQTVADRVWVRSWDCKKLK
jgi:hypothetical protein